MMDRRRTSPRLARRQAGLTMVELLVALVLDLVIILAIATLFFQSTNYRKQVERSSRQLENGRYAMQVLTEDLRMAGYLGPLDVRALGLPGAGAKPDPCLTSDADLNNAMAFTMAVQAYDGGAALSCISDHKADTDIVVVRRASTCISGEVDCNPVAGAPYIEASACNDTGQLGDIDRTNWYRLGRAIAAGQRRTRRDCVTLADQRQFLVHIYFIANNDRPGDGIPTLKRAELTGAGFEILPIANGIENLQIEYGIDSNPIEGDGVVDGYTNDPDTFVDPTSGVACSYPDCADDILTANVQLLARSLEPRPLYTDTKIYALGRNPDGSSFEVGPFEDNFERHVFGSIAQLVNPSIRRQ